MYDATKVREISNDLPSDTILDGVIIEKIDGEVKDFITEGAKSTWKGELNNPAVEFIIEVIVGAKSVKIKQMFTYLLDDDTPVFTQNSNMGKYNAKYGKAPDVGDKVKIITNSDGYGKVKLN